MTSSNPNYLTKTPSPNTIILGNWASIYECGGGGRHLASSRHQTNYSTNILNYNTIKFTMEKCLVPPFWGQVGIRKGSPEEVTLHVLCPGNGRKVSGRAIAHMKA